MCNPFEYFLDEPVVGNIKIETLMTHWSKYSLQNRTYVILASVHIETFFIEIKILATVDSGPKIHTRMSRAFERAPT